MSNFEEGMKKEGMQLSLFKSEFSPFKLEMFHSCPRKYKFHYVDRLARFYKKPRPYFTMGENIHSALKSFYLLPKSKRSPIVLEQLLLERWEKNRRGFSSAEDEEKWKERALNQVRLFAQTQDLSAVPLFVEEYHKAILSPSVVLGGRVDRVDSNGNGFHIIDYKTGSVMTEINPRQLQLYTLILSKELHRDVNKASYLFLESGEFVSVPIGNEALREAEQWAIQMAERIVSEKEFKTVAGRRTCGNCDFREICPEWSIC